MDQARGPFFAPYRGRPVRALLGLGFAAGLPLLLTGSTLSAWLAGEHVDLGAIGLFSLVGLPYSLKFLWAPLFDVIGCRRPPRRRPRCAGPPSSRCGPCSVAAAPGASSPSWSSTRSATRSCSGC